MERIVISHKSRWQRVKKGGNGLLSNEHGFSLLEMLIASVVLLISMLALLGLTITSIQVNMQNDIRNTAIRLTTQTAEALLTQPVESLNDCGLSPDPNAPNYNAAFTYDVNNACLGTTGANGFRVYPNPVQSIRGVNRSFNIVWDVTTLTNDLRQIAIAVSYEYRGRDYTNNTVIYKHRAI